MVRFALLMPAGKSRVFLIFVVNPHLDLQDKNQDLLLFLFFMLPYYTALVITSLSG